MSGGDAISLVTGQKQAKEVMLIGDNHILAERAHPMGLVNKIVPDEKLHAKGQRLASKIAQAAPDPVQKSNLAINRSRDIMEHRRQTPMMQDLDVDINAMPTWERKSSRAFVRNKALRPPSRGVTHVLPTIKITVEDVR